MSLRLSILQDHQLCVVSGEGTVTRADIEAYVASTVREGVKHYAKLVDLTGCKLALDHDDLEAVSRGLVQYGWGERPGPVGIVVDTALNLDMAVLIKQRVGDRPFRIFTAVGAARAWLTSYHDIYASDTPLQSLSPRHRGVRAP